MKYISQIQKGFTLIELMIAVVIIAIIASMGWSFFDAQARKGTRFEAIDALTRIAALQERWHSQNGTYHGDVVVLYGLNSTTFVDYRRPTAANPQPSGRPASGTYNLQINLIDADTYTATATHIALPDPNDEDQDCFTFSINHAGARMSMNKAGTITSDPADNANYRNCWSQ